MKQPIEQCPQPDCPIRERAYAAEQAGQSVDRNKREAAKGGVTDALVDAARTAYGRALTPRIGETWNQTLFRSMRVALETVLPMVGKVEVPDGWRSMQECPINQDLLFWNNGTREMFFGYKPEDAPTDDAVVSDFTACFADAWVHKPAAPTPPASKEDGV